MRIKYKDSYNRVVIEDFSRARLVSETTIQIGNMFFEIPAATHVFEFLLVYGYSDFTNYNYTEMQSL